MLTEVKETVRSIKRSFQILECFSNGKSELSIGQLAQMTELNKTTIFRILFTMMELGYVRQDPDTQKYRLSWKLYHLGTSTFTSMDLRTSALPAMQELCVEINETIALNIMEGYERVRIEVVECRDLIRYIHKVGDRHPLFFGASGRAMLAFLPETEQQQVVSHALQKFEMNEESMREQLAEVREKGYAIGLEEGIIGAFSLSAPIFDHHGKLAGSINTSGPLQRWQEERIPYLIERVVSAARRISEAIGHLEEYHKEAPNLEKHTLLLDGSD